MCEVLKALTIVAGLIAFVLFTLSAAKVLHKHNLKAWLHFFLVSFIYFVVMTALSASFVTLRNVCKEKAVVISEDPDAKPSIDNDD